MPFACMARGGLTTQISATPREKATMVAVRKDLSAVRCSSH
jgi:hypothetical protein